MVYVAWIQCPCRLQRCEHCTPCSMIKSVKLVRRQSSLIDHLIASTRHSSKPISLGISNRTICVGPNCWIISCTIPCWNCDCPLWLRGNWRLIWKSLNICLAIWCRCCSPCCNVISQQILMQRWQWEFFCILHNILLVCPRLCLYSVPGQCLLNFSTALDNAQFLPVMCTFQLVNDCFLPAMCTPQKEWFKRARSFFGVCLATSRSMSHTRIVTLTWGGLWGQ